MLQCLCSTRKPSKGRLLIPAHLHRPRCAEWVDNVAKTQAVGNKVRLVLPMMDSRSDWCLRGCSSSSCQLPRTGSGAYPAGLANAYFTRPCPADNSSQWQSIVHASGFQRWKNVATGKCLSLRQAYAYNYAGEIWAM